MDVLTKRQADILQAIKEFMAKNGYPPTVREIGSQVGLSSPATIQFHLTQLEQKGYIKKSNAKNRTIELLVPNELAQTDDDVVNVPLSKQSKCQTNSSHYQPHYFLLEKKYSH